MGGVTHRWMAAVMKGRGAGEGCHWRRGCGGAKGMRGQGCMGEKECYNYLFDMISLHLNIINRLNSIFFILLHSPCLFVFFRPF